MARKPTDLVPVTPEILTRIHAEIKRTGIHPDRLIVSAKSVPSGLGANIPERWFTSSEPSSARQAHIDFILGAYGELPTVRDARVRPKYSIDGKAKRQPITEAYRERMRQEIARTGLSPQMLLKRRHNAPKGVTPTALSRWLSGATKAERADSLNWLVAAYAGQPDAAKPVPARQRKSTGDRITITDDHRMEIQIHKRRTGLTWQQIVDRIPDAPEGLSAAVLSEWVNGHRETADKKAVHLTLELLRRLGDNIN